MFESRNSSLTKCLWTFVFSLSILLKAGCAPADPQTMPVSPKVPSDEASGSVSINATNVPKQGRQPGVSDEELEDAHEELLDETAVVAALEERGAQLQQNKRGQVVFVKLPRGTQNETLEALAGLSEMSVLELFESNVTDDGLVLLQGQTKLKHIVLTGTPITGSGLQYLQGLPVLARLELAWTEITNDSIPKLQGLPKLEYLDLSATAISDASVESLSELTWLKTLNVEYTDLSLEGITRIRTALPNSRVISSFVPKSVVDEAEPLPETDPQVSTLEVGDMAPEIEGEDVEGEVFRLSEYRGEVVVLDFWGLWCPHCRAMFPTGRAMVKRFAEQPFAWLGVNSDRDREYLKTVIKREQINWRSFWDGGSPSGPIAAAWDVLGWPTIYVLDAQGTIRFKNLRGSELEVAVEQLLAEVVEQKED